MGMPQQKETLKTKIIDMVAKKAHVSQDAIVVGFIESSIVNDVGVEVDVTITVPNINDVGRVKSALDDSRSTFEDIVQIEGKTAPDTPIHIEKFKVEAPGVSLCWPMNLRRLRECWEEEKYQKKENLVAKIQKEIIMKFSNDV